MNAFLQLREANTLALVLVNYFNVLSFTPVEEGQTEILLAAGERITVTESLSEIIDTITAKAVWAK